MIHFGDITKISGYDVPIVDCVTFGAPCQDLSVAGKRKGMKHEDMGDEETTRSGLYHDAIRIIKEMREYDERINGRSGELIRPRYAVYENVPGAFSSNRGQDFRIVLEELAKIAEKDAVIPMPPKDKWSTSGCIVGDGWSIAWRVFDAQFWGVPQRRRRIALVADFGGQCAQEILFIRNCLQGDSSESGTERKRTSSNAQGSIGVYDRDGRTSIRPLTLKIRSGCEGGGKGALIQEDKSATLSCNNDQYLFQPFVMESAIALEPGIASREGGHIYKGVSGTLRANAGDNQMSVVYSYDIGDRRRVPNEYEDVSPTLLGQMGTGGNNVPVIMDKNYLDVELEVAVRKHEVDCNKLSECLRDHKESLKLSNKHIADSLARSITEVEHWFRNDKYFSIPSADIWYDLKEMLGIETDEFDKSITEFEFKGGVYDMRNRIHIGETTPTLKSDCGNSLHLVPVIVEGVDCYNQSLTGDKAKSLTSAATDSDHLPCIVMDRASYNQGENALYNIGIDENGVAFSHIAKGPGAVCYCLQGNQVDRADTSVCNGSGWKEDTSYTLNTMDRHVVVYNGENITSPYNKTNPQIGDACHTLTSDSRNYLVETKPHYIVRRLTPLECERLQGFPDGWTDIGEYIDSKGKKKKSSDSARYKALGNSIALPPWKWVIKRLCSHYERDATLASLFDGIGGFPLLWEQINGKGSCLWASEIEDFPIAVTKKRIGGDAHD